MAATIKAASGIESQLVQGSGGVFDVVVDGEQVFSKHTEGRFPADDEIFAQIV